MVDSREQRAREMQLERLLRDLLGEVDDVQPGDSGAATSPEVAELRDMAQRFRMAVHRIPLREGRRALLRALVTSAALSPEPTTKRVPYRPWRAVAGAAAVLLLGVSIAGVGSRWGGVPSSSPRYGIGIGFKEGKVAPTGSSVGEAQMDVAEPRASGNVRVPPATRAVRMSRGVVRATRTGPQRRTLVKYAVSFGAFFNRPAADTMMHLIRSKGYVVYVARIGEDFRVVTRPYRTRAQAERLANALQEIGLPAQLTTAREWQVPYAGVSAGKIWSASSSGCINRVKLDGEGRMDHAFTWLYESQETCIRGYVGAWTSKG